MGVKFNILFCLSLLVFSYSVSQVNNRFNYRSNLKQVKFFNQDKGLNNDHHIVFLLPFCANKNDFLINNHIDSLIEKDLTNLDLYRKTQISVDFYLGFLSSLNHFDSVDVKISIFDIKEGEESGKRNIVISGVLLDNIEKKINKNEKILLIQNRRGFSPSVKCSDCGEVAMCLACKTPLTYHKYDNNLKCHLCGYIDLESFDNCKACLSSNLFYMGTGTQKIEIILKETFPQACIVRVDHDSVKDKLNMVNTLQSFHDGEIDILIGTQMIAKGLDFPDITLVGIINADLGLHMPDFRSSERIFQLIYQASGRSGRGAKEGQVIIQTYDSENPVIKAASKLDLNEYYKIMLEDRFILKYPPYSWIIKIEFIGPQSKSVLSLSNKIRRNLLNKFKGLEILGPAACFKEKIKNNYRYQLILKSLKKYDSNGEKIHLFINDNFIKHNNSGNGLNKINIHVDPMSMI